MTHDPTSRPNDRSLRPDALVFERFTLSALLGRGAHGAVWRARDHLLDRDIALKFLPPAIAVEPAAMDAFRLEARRALDLTHPNIVRIHDFFQADGLAAISMECVEGPTLAELKREAADGVLTCAQILAWLEGVCSALDHAHREARLVHRDLKPGNILLGKRDTPKIADFGISAPLLDACAEPSSGHRASGTPSYMSPQQLRDEPARPADDIYSLGATLYELLTGKPPFHSGSIAAQIELSVPPPLHARRAELGLKPGEPIPEVWEKTLAACLHKDPALRPASARDVFEALSANPRAAAASPARKTRWLSAIALGCALLVAAAGIAYYGFILPEERAREAARRLAAERLETARQLSVERARLREADAERTRLQTAFDDVNTRAFQLQEAARTGTPATSSATLPTATPTGEAEKRRLAEAAHPWSAIVAWIGEAKRPLWEQPTLAATSTLKDGGPGSEEYSSLGAQLEQMVERSRMGAPVFEFSHLAPRYETLLERKFQSARQAADLFRADFGLKFRNGQAPEWPALPLVKDDGYLAGIRARLPASTDTPGFAPVNQMPAPASVAVAASTDAPSTTRENSLGMRFISVTGLTALASIWETRVRDYTPFAADRLDLGWVAPTNPTGLADHPVTNVSHDDALAFCAWLTARERASGIINSVQHYRLPTDQEWTHLAGVDDANPGSGSYPWPGIQTPRGPSNFWPPRDGAGNYHPNLRTDSHDQTSPVGSFSTNVSGLHDIGGNVWEWTASNAPASGEKLLRGASHVNESKEHLNLRYRASAPASARRSVFGFRVLLDTAQTSDTPAPSP